MRVRSVTPEGLVNELVERIAKIAEPDGWTRVAVDGAPAAGPDRLAEALVDPLRARGHAALHVRTADFLRPASVRLEFGRTDPDAYYDGWFDAAGLRREVLDPLGPGGTGRVLPTLWDAVADRATRARPVHVSDRAVVVVDGWLLLGRGLPADLTVHVALSAAARERRVATADAARELPAYARYDEEVRPAECADLVVRADDPRRPALVDRRRPGSR
jgi:hypothetical protein